MGTGLVPGGPRAPAQTDTRTRRALQRLAGAVDALLFGDTLTKDSTGKLDVNANSSRLLLANQVFGP